MQKFLLGVLFYIASFGANAGPSPDAFSAFTITLAQKSVVDDPSAPYGFDISFVVFNHLSHTFDSGLFVM